MYLATSSHFPCMKLFVRKFIKKRNNKKNTETGVHGVYGVCFKLVKLMILVSLYMAV